MKAIGLTNKINLYWISIFIVFLLVANLTIYPDEQAYVLQLYRGFADDGLINNFMPMCSSFWTVHVPITWYPSRFITNILFGYLKNPILFRLVGVLIFAAIVYFFMRLMNLIRREYHESDTFNYLAGVLFLGYIPISLVYIRPESIILLVVLISITAYFFVLTRKRSYILCSFFILFSYALIVPLHGRVIFLLPLFIYLALSLLAQSKRWLLGTLILFLFICVLLDSVVAYKKIYSCSEYAAVESILASLRFDPRIISSGWLAVINEFKHRISEAYLVTNGVVLRNIAGSFPLEHAAYSNFIELLFGYIQTTVILFILFLTYIFVRASLKIKSLFASGAGNFYLVSFFIMLFLLLESILLKTDRFYETAIFLPLAVVAYTLLCNLKLGIPVTNGVKIRIFVNWNFCIIFYISVIIFSVYHFKELIVKGGVTYLSPRNYNNTQYELAVDKVFQKLGVDKYSAKLVVGDFFTINQIQDTKFPILANFFWWFTESIYNQYNGSYNRLYILNQLGSDGIVMSCNSVPADIRNIFTTLDDNSTQLTLCYLGGKDLRNIDFESHQSK